MRTFDDMLSKQLKDDEFRKEYEAIQPEMDVIRAIVDARTSQNMTQKELAERTGINQADISKLENGTRNPSVNLLKRLADGMGMALKIEFVPKQKALYQLMSKLNEAEISIREEGTISADDLEKELCRNGQEQVK